MHIVEWRQNKDWGQSQSLLNSQISEKLAVRPVAAFGAFVHNAYDAEIGTLGSNQTAATQKGNAL